MSGPVLITGAAGFAGGHLLDLLTRDGVEVVAWCREGGAAPRAVPNVRWEAVDLLDRRQVGRRLGDIRPGVVYHCAGAAHVGRSWENAEATFAVNVRGTHHVIEGLRDHGVAARVLITSSALVYAPSTEPICEDHGLVPSSPYGLSKLAQELLGGHADGPQVLIARAFNHFGPRQDPGFVASRFARRIADIEARRFEPEMAVGNLDASRDLTDVRDTVRAYRKIAECGVPGRPYNVCSGRGIVIRDLLDRFLARSRVSIRIRVDPSRYRPNDLPVLVGDPTRISTELGWKAALPLDETIDDLLSYWRLQAGEGGAAS